MDLSKLDPNVVVVVGSLLTTALGWLWAKIRGEKHAGLSEAIWPIVEGVAIKLAESEATVDFVREKLTAAAWQGLERMKIKRSAIVEVIVAKLVERGVTEVRKRALALKASRDLEATLASAAAVRVDAPAPGPRVPVIGEGVPGEFVRICPLPGCDQLLNHEGPHGLTQPEGGVTP
jgi:hypothetical protein